MTSAREDIKRSGKSFRHLLEQLELACKFYGADEVLSAANELLAHSKYDTYEVMARVTDDTGTNMKTVSFSSNPEVVYTKLLTFDKETTGATLEVVCGHCGQKVGARSLSSWGPMNKSHIKFLIDNFPEEL